MSVTFKCWRCGNTVKLDEDQNERVYCEECQGLVRDEHKDLIRRYADLKRAVMVETAVRKMERAGMYMQDYYDIAKTIKVEIDAKEDRFLSADEIIAAMVLQSYNIEYEANKRIGSYAVDFFLPDMHVCLEIDGDRHESKRISDSKRDIEIRQELGAEWEVIRIKTNYLEKDPEKLLDAIDALYAEKKKLRAQNNGIIPEHFSKRERDHYETAAEWKKVSAKRWGSRYY